MKAKLPYKAVYLAIALHFVRTLLRKMHILKPSWVIRIPEGFQGSVIYNAVLVNTPDGHGRPYTVVMIPVYTMDTDAYRNSMQEYIVAHAEIMKRLALHGYPVKVPGKTTTPHDVKFEILGPLGVISSSAAFDMTVYGPGTEIPGLPRETAEDIARTTGEVLKKVLKKYVDAQGKKKNDSERKAGQEN